MLPAQDQREEFSRQLQQQLGVRGLKADDWGDLFWQLSQYVQKGRVIVVFDEINLMESHESFLPEADEGTSRMSGRSFDSGAISCALFGGNKVFRGSH
jgi:hypothetical protein